MKIAPVFARHARNCAGSGGSVKATRYAGGLCPALTFAAVLPAVSAFAGDGTKKRSAGGFRTKKLHTSKRQKGRKAERQNTLTPFLKPLFTLHS